MIKHCPIKPFVLESLLGEVNANLPMNARHLQSFNTETAYNLRGGGGRPRRHSGISTLDPPNRRPSP